MRITVDIRDDLPKLTSLVRVGVWYVKHREDPVKTPLQGVQIHDDGMVIAKRNYRKGDCFVIYQDAARKKEQPTKEARS